MKTAVGNQIFHGGASSKKPRISFATSAGFPNIRKCPAPPIYFSRAFGALRIIDSAVDRDITTLCSARRIREVTLQWAPQSAMAGIAMNAEQRRLDARPNVISQLQPA
jgi:hypothetical protein